MAKQTFGIGGPWSGQIGKTYVGLRVVNGYAVRKYVIPPNPRTVAQVAQRGKFGLAGRLASLLKDSIILDLWNPFAVNVYGVNNFTGKNTKALTNDTDFPSIITSSGGYEPIASFTDVLYTSGSGHLVVTWNTGFVSVGKATDIIYAVIIDANDWDPATDKYNLIAYVSNNLTRAEGGTGYDVVVGAGKDNTKFHVYATARNPVAETKLKVSASKYSAVGVG